MQSDLTIFIKKKFFVTFALPHRLIKLIRKSSSIQQAKGFSRIYFLFCEKKELDAIRGHWMIHATNVIKYAMQ